ncbi:DNA-protecting protein DprA [Patescibacteria group bacterium]|nr:DNA-protecting protein DprA [Patescibacteria group bacterium]
MQATINEVSGTAIPELLRTLEQPPEVLRYRGVLPGDTPIAIVGTRRPSAYGRRTAAVLGARIAAAGFPVVSGLAFGIDTEVHRAVLDAGGRSVAILPGGIDDHSISPRTNLPLAHRILKAGGVLVSEYPAGTTAMKFRYIARNRLISGWAKAVVIVEAGLPSGSLLTAQHAIDQGRELWAVPGTIESAASRGTNKLIADGAHPLVSVDHFMETLGVMVHTPSDGISSVLGSEASHIDELAERLQLVPSELETELTKLELRGVVKHLGGRYYVRV